MMLYGKVLWWSDRNQNGIIVDSKGNEFYFDKSVIKSLRRSSVKRNSFVTFQCNTRIKTCLCAMDVELPTAQVKTQLQRKFEMESRESA